MVALATLVQTAFHPGIFFPRLSSRWQEPNTATPTEKYESSYSLGEGKVV